MFGINKRFQAPPSLVLCFILFCPLLIFSDALVLKGRTGYPYFHADGKLGFLYVDSQQNFFTENGELVVLDTVLHGTRPPAGISRILQIKKDRINRNWILWELETAERKDIYAGIISGSHIQETQNISLQQEGHNFSPAIDFSGLNQPFVVWVNFFQSQYTLIVKNLESSHAWILNFESMLSFFSPQILFDGQQRPWIFWVGREGESMDGIYYTRLAGGRWNEPAPLTFSPSIPHFHPATAADHNGFPHIVWSGYDGKDYEIFFAFWTGTQWSRAEKVSDNRGAADTQPSLCLFYHTVPLVSWTSAGGGNRDIFLSVRSEGHWLPAVNVSQDAERSGSSKILSENHHIALVWEAGDKIFVQSLTYPQLFLETDRPEKVIIQQKESSHLRDNRFTAFGDSITYGWMGGPAPDKGYGPRLEILLESLFTNPLVINRGVPAEPTWEAMTRAASVIVSDLALFFLLMEGTNDVSTLDYSINTIAFNLLQIIDTCIKYGVFPLLSTIIPRSGERDTPLTRQRTINLNNKIKQMAQDLNIMDVDNYAAFNTFPLEQGGPESLIFDGLHPNEKGYQLLAEEWHNRILVIPYPPESIQAKRMQRDDTIQLSWEENTKITAATQLAAYHIYRKTRGESAYTWIGQTDATMMSYTDSQALPDTDYTYMIRAANWDSQQGPPSDPVMVGIGDPFPPTGLQIQLLTNRSFLYTEYVNQITWNANVDNQGLFSIGKYRIYRKREGEKDDKFQYIGEVPSSRLEFLDRFLPSPEVASGYVYGVSAVDVNGIEGPIGTSS